MSDSNTAATGGKGKGGKKAKVREVYATLDEAKAAKPEREKDRPIEVLHNGKTVGFVLASNANKGLLAVCRRDGYSAKIAEPKAGGPMTKERLADGLAKLSDEDRAVLIAQYVPAPGKKAAGKK
jgi:hypothetical protein